jgi:hypothetical protein
MDDEADRRLAVGRARHLLSAVMPPPGPGDRVGDSLAATVE